MSEEQVESQLETIQDKVSKWVTLVKLLGGIGVGFIVFVFTVGATYNQLTTEIQGMKDRWTKKEVEWSIERQGVQADIGKLRAEIAEIKSKVAESSGKLDVILQRVK